MFSLTEKSKALNDFVIIKILPNKKVQIGNIFTKGNTEDGIENMKLVKGIVLSSGKISEHKYGIIKDDIVMFDKHSIFGDTILIKGTETPDSIVATRAENVILNIKE